MTGSIVYCALGFLIVAVFVLCYQHILLAQRLEHIGRELNNFAATADHLKKFSKNLEALFAVEKKKGGSK